LSDPRSFLPTHFPTHAHQWRDFLWAFSDRKEARHEETEGQEEVLTLDTVKASRWSKRTGP